MTREDMATLLGSAWSRVWAIHARASGKTETNPALAEVAGAALADISVVRAFLADNPAWVSPAAALDVCRRAIHTSMDTRNGDIYATKELAKAAGVPDDDLVTGSREAIIRVRGRGADVGRAR